MEISNKKWYQKIGWLGLVACGLCCALPIIGAVAGIASLTAFGIYFEKIGIVVLGIAAILFAIHYYQKNKAKKVCSTSCETDCGCKTEAATK
jgi:hypothetical protein